jgi:hypothetical protein
VTPPDPQPAHRAALVAQLALVLFFLLSAGLLAYETLALGSNGRFAPITSYVRCATAAAHPLALIGACAASFLFGHWFWYPRRRP